MVGQTISDRKHWCGASFSFLLKTETYYLSSTTEHFNATLGAKTLASKKFHTFQFTRSNG